MATARSASVIDTIEQTMNGILTSLSGSYGPKGLDKLISKDKETIVTNDGATILQNYKSNPIHKIIGGTSHSQDVNCGDGTTSVVLLTGTLMERLVELKRKGLHPSHLSAALEIVKSLALKYIDETKIKIGEEEYINVALTSLSSKIAARSVKMAQVAVDSLKQTNKSKIKIVKQVGGSLDDVEFVNGMLLALPSDIRRYNLLEPTGDISCYQKHKLLLLQFCISAPKTNIDSKIIIDDYSLMEQFVREERDYVIKLIKAIKKSGATLIFIQKSLLRESCSELAVHFLKKAGISFVDGIERKDMEETAEVLGTRPISDVDLIDEPCEVEVRLREGLIEIKNYGSSIIVSGCDQIVADEAERSLNDALCVVKSLMNEPYVVPGGGSVETGIAVALEEYNGAHSMIIHEISQAFQALPHFLARNAGLYAVETITQLKRNIKENRNLGISLRTGYIADMINDDSIIQPVAVSKSTVVLALETAQMLIKIDDILPARY